MRNKSKIDPSVTYTLKEMAEERLFEPYVDSNDIRAYRKLIGADRRNRNILRAFIMGQGRQIRYRVLGRNILKFLDEIETGTYQL